MLSDEGVHGAKAELLTCCWRHRVTLDPSYNHQRTLLRDMTELITTAWPPARGPYGAIFHGNLSAAITVETTRRYRSEDIAVLRVFSTPLLAKPGSALVVVTSRNEKAVAVELRSGNV